MSIAKLFPVLLEKTSFVIPDRKVQGVFGYLAKVLCAEDESSDIYADALICMNEVIPFPPLNPLVRRSSLQTSCCFPQGCSPEPFCQDIFLHSRESSQIPI